jgi:hypothetical protein
LIRASRQDLADGLRVAAGRIESDRHGQEWQTGENQADKSKRPGRNYAFLSSWIVKIRAARQPKQDGKRDEAAQRVERRGGGGPELRIVGCQGHRLQRGETLCERPVDFLKLRRREKNVGGQDRHNDRYEIRFKRGEDSLDVLAHDVTDRLFNNWA